MSLRDKFIKGGDAHNARRLARLERNAAEHQDFDRYVLDDIKSQSPAYASDMDKPITYTQPGGTTGVYEPGPDLHDDMFLGAHTPGDSKVRSREDMRPSHQLGREVANEVFKTDEWQAMKPHTESDDIASAIAARAAKDKIRELLESAAMEQHVEQSQQLHEQEQQQQAIQDAIDQLKQEAREAAANGEPTPLGNAQAQRELIEQREQGAQQLAQDAANGKPLPTGVVKQAAKGAAQDAADKVEVWNAVCGTASTEFGHVNPDDAYALAEAWMAIPDYREFVRILGRVERDFRSADARNVIGGDDEIIGIEHGNDLSRVLTSELALLGGTEAQQRQFLKAYVDEDLMQFQTQGTERVSNGPGVFCIDMSGSMSGTPAMQAKAVGVGFVRLMHKKRRDAVVLCFNGRVAWRRHFKRSEPLKMEDLLSLAAVGATGGTTGITAAVQEALKACERQPGFKKADVLVITDGQVSFDREAGVVRDKLTDMGVRKFGIAIGHTPAKGGWLLTFCDDAISVDALTEATGDIVRAVS